MPKLSQKDIDYDELESLYKKVNRKTGKVEITFTPEGWYIKEGLLTNKDRVSPQRSD